MRLLLQITVAMAATITAPEDPTYWGWVLWGWDNTPQIEEVHRAGPRRGTASGHRAPMGTAGKLVSFLPP